MRYFGTDKMIFTDSAGNGYTLYEPQDIQESSSGLIFRNQINLRREDELDEIAQRRNVYGENNEDSWYKLFDFNIVEIVENDFSILGLKTLNIPR